MTMIERMQELERRVGAVENERARNITALVEEGAEVKRRLDTIEFDLRTLYRNAGIETRIRTDIGKRVAQLEERKPPMTTHDAYTELHNRMSALESRLPAAIPVVTPLEQPRCRDCGTQLATVRDGFGEAFQCPGCDEPPDPLPASLAPTPDYSSERPAEVEACSCEESEQLRAELGAASVELRQLATECDRLRAAVPFPDDPDRVATLAVKLASETDSYQRALRTEYAKREAVESELSAALQAIDLLRSLDNVQRAVAYLDRAERAERRLEKVDEGRRNYAADVEELRSEMGEINLDLARMQRERNEAMAEREQLRRYGTLVRESFRRMRRERDDARAELTSKAFECQRLLDESDSRLNRIGGLVADLTSANALLRIHATQPLHPDVRAYFSTQPTATDRGKALDAVGWEASADHDRAALLEAMGRDMDRCRAGLKPEHAIDPRLDRYAERLAERVVGGI